MEEEFNQFFNGLDRFGQSLTSENALEYFETTPYYTATLMGPNKDQRNPNL